MSTGASKGSETSGVEQEGKDATSVAGSGHASPEASDLEPQETSTKQSASEAKLSKGSSRQANTPRRPFTRQLPTSAVRSMLDAAGIDPRHATHLTPRLNQSIKTAGQDRFIKPANLELAAKIQGSSLYTRPLGLLQWQLMYHEIYLAKHYKREIGNRALILQLREEGEKLLAKVKEDCLGSFREQWQTMDRSSKRFAWVRLAGWLLQNDPKLLPEFLLVTTEGNGRPDFTMVVDCLRYLDNFYYDQWLKDWQSGTHTYQSLVETCLHPHIWPIISLPHKGVRLFIRRAGHEAVSLAFDTVNERSIQMRSETALCFMWRFTEFKDVDRALKALAMIPTLQEPKFHMNSEGVKRHCCKLLLLDTVEEGTGGRNFKILPQLLEMGITPDRDMLNVVLANAYKTDPQLGADILAFMKNHDYKLDSYSYLTLLSDAVARGDRGRVDSFIRDIGSHEELRKNPWLASKIFHSHYIFTVKAMDADSDPSSIFYSMLDLYNHIHDITPLKELTIIPPRYTPRDDSAKLPPSPVALFLIMATYFRCQNRFSNVQRIYASFRELVAAGHPSIAPMVETDHAYNEFLVAFRQTPRGLRSCVQLVDDMLHNSTPFEDQNGKTIVPAKPTVRTWTLLQGAFIYNKQTAAAEKIREMMDKHKVKYNDVTWNVIINGYANAQNIPDTAASIKAMENQGFPIDSYTMKSLRYLRDPERLWVSIEELDGKATDMSQAEITSGPQSTITSELEEPDTLLENGLGKLGSKMKSNH